MSALLFSTTDLLRVAKAFPATPRILAEIGRILRDPRADLSEIAIHLKRDSGLAARLMRIANSAALAQAEPVASVEDATAVIGLQEVHRLVGAIAVDQFAVSDLTVYGVSGRRFRENSIFTALLMEELADPAEEDAPTAYTIGLLRSIGKLALEKLALEAGQDTRFDPAVHVDLQTWEKASFGLTSNEATGLILQNWHFPHEIPKAIVEHFAAAGRSHPFTHLLNLSAQLADTLGYGLPGEGAYWLKTDEVYRRSGLDPDRLKPHIDRAFIAFDRLSRALG